MKRALSLILTVAMLVSCVVFTAGAASDTCIRFSDTSGSAGYSAGASDINNYVIAQDGATLIFDVNVQSTTAASAGLFSQILAFTSDTNYNHSAYNFGDSKFTVGAGTKWPTDSQTNAYTRLAERDFEMYKGVWYELAFQFDGNEVVIYVDGTPMVAAELDTVDNKYLILYPQFCTIFIDNLRVCDKNYNVRDKVGTVQYATDFSGITSVSGCSSVWDFSGAGYSVSQSGRPMPGISDMVPVRGVSPAAKGNYLQYKESGGSGIAQLSKDFSDYKGFVYVEDVRIDRKSVGANFAVRFGTNYIAGYDWDKQSFIISTRSGYGFSTASAYCYAVAEYTLEVGKTYEFAVRQTGSLVAIYLNGVMITSAVNDSFDTGYNAIQISHYRVGATIDNVVIAYPDYDIKEATGKTLNSITFDESVDYLNSVCGLNIGVSGYGYSIVKGSAQPKVLVDSVEAADGKATVGIALADCLGYDAFEMSVTYNSALSVSIATAAEIAGGYTVLSPTTSTPFVLSCVTDSTPITNTDVLDITFNAPGASGDYEVNVTVTPYLNDVPMAPITGTGTITVPKGGVTEGLPTGLSYDGTTLSWDYLDDAVFYGIYVIYSDGYEEMIDETEDTEYELIFEDYFGDPAEYKFQIYAYDEYYELYAKSEPYSVIYTEDGDFYFGLDSYADVLYENLLALINDRDYSDENQAIVDALIAEAEDKLYSADYESIDALYEYYYSELDAVPEGATETVIHGDTNGDGIINTNDITYLSRMMSGASVEVYPGCDVNGDGIVNTTDLSTLRRNLA